MKSRPAYRTTTLLVFALALIGLSVSCLQPHQHQHQHGDYLENAEEQQSKPGQGPQELPAYHAE